MNVWRAEMMVRTGSISNIAIGLLPLLLITGLMLPSAQGQSPGGNNAVYNSTGGLASSTAVIDASVFASTSTNICETIFSILNGTSGYGPYPANGAVVDARGLTSSNSNLTCKSSPLIE